MAKVLSVSLWLQKLYEQFVFVKRPQNEKRFVILLYKAIKIFIKFSQSVNLRSGKKRIKIITAVAYVQH